MMMAVGTSHRDMRAPLMSSHILCIKSGICRRREAVGIIVQRNIARLRNHVIAVHRRLPTRRHSAYFPPHILQSLIL